MRNHGLLYSFPSNSVSRCPKCPGQPGWPPPVRGSSSWQSPGLQPPCWKSGTPCQNPSHTCQTITVSFTWPVSRSPGIVHLMKHPSPLDAGWGSQSTWTCFCQICASLAPPALQTGCPDSCGQFICGLRGLPGGWQRESLPLGGGRFVGLPAQQVGAEGKLGVQGQGQKNQAGAQGLFTWCWPLFLSFI